MWQLIYHPAGVLNLRRWAPTTLTSSAVLSLRRRGQHLGFNWVTVPTGRLSNVRGAAGARGLDGADCLAPLPLSHLCRGAHRPRHDAPNFIWNVSSSRWSTSGRRRMTAATSRYKPIEAFHFTGQLAAAAMNDVLVAVDVTTGPSITDGPAGETTGMSPAQR